MFVFVVRCFYSNSTNLKHLDDLFTCHFPCVVNIVIGKFIPKTKQNKDGEFQDGEMLKDGGMMLLKLLNLKDVESPEKR